MSLILHSLKRSKKKKGLFCEDSFQAGKTFHTLFTDHGEKRLDLLMFLPEGTSFYSSRQEMKTIRHIELG